MEEHIKSLGNEFGFIYNNLCNQYFNILLKWEEFKELYASSPNRIVILKKTASRFFRIVKDLFWNDILLSLSRLMDSEKSCGKINLTFKSLPKFIKEEDFRCDIENSIVKLENEFKIFKDLRNKRLAHLDLNLLIRKDIKPLSTVTIKHTEEVLNLIHSILAMISYKYFKQKLFKKILKNNSGSISLLYVLREGLEVEELRSSRIRSGNFTLEDIKIKNEI